MDSKWSNVSSVGPQLAFMLSVSAVPPIFLYSDLYLNTAYAAHWHLFHFWNLYRRAQNVFCQLISLKCRERDLGMSVTTMLFFNWKCDRRRNFLKSVKKFSPFPFQCFFFSDFLLTFLVRHLFPSHLKLWWSLPKCRRRKYLEYIYIYKRLTVMCFFISFFF